MKAIGWCVLFLLLLDWFSLPSFTLAGKEAEDLEQLKKDFSSLAEKLARLSQSLKAETEEEDNKVEFMINSTADNPRLRTELLAVKNRYLRLFELHPDCPRLLILHADTAGFGHTVCAIGTGLMYAIEFDATFMIDASFFDFHTHSYRLADYAPQVLNLGFPPMRLVYSKSELDQLAERHSMQESSVERLEELRQIVFGCRRQIRANFGSTGFCDGLFCSLVEPLVLTYFREVMLPLFHLKHPVSPFVDSRCIEVGVHFRDGDIRYRSGDAGFFGTIFRLLESVSFGFPCFHYTFYSSDDNINLPVQTNNVPPQFDFLDGVVPPNTTFRIHYSPSDDFIMLAMSDILVLSESSFSYAAAALSYDHAVLLLPPNKELFSQGRLLPGVRNQYSPRPDVVFLDFQGKIFNKDALMIFHHKIDHLRRISSLPNFRQF